MLADKTLHMLKASLLYVILSDIKFQTIDSGSDNSEFTSVYDSAHQPAQRKLSCSLSGSLQCKNHAS